MTRTLLLCAAFLLMTACGDDPTPGGDRDTPGCRLDSDCEIEQACTDGACVDVEPCEGEQCPCRTDADCSQGQACGEQDTCVQASCLAHADCLPGELCQSGACVTDADADRDRDGVPDGAPGSLVDNCTDTPNPDQADTDADGLGDLCDEDDDGDGVPDRGDRCPTVPDPDQFDADNDGAGNACDPDFTDLTLSGRLVADPAQDPDYTRARILIVGPGVSAAAITPASDGTFSAAALSRPGRFDLVVQWSAWTVAPTPFFVPDGVASHDLGDIEATHESALGDTAVMLAGTATLSDRSEHADVVIRARRASNDALLGTTLTAPDGAFVLSAARDEVYTLQASRQGYAPADSGPLRWDAEDRRFEDDDGQPPALTLDPVDVEGSVAVTVSVGPSWLPQEQRWTTVTLSGNEGSALRQERVGHGQTFTFDNIRAGSHILAAQRAGFSGEQRVVTVDLAQRDHALDVDVDVDLVDLGAAEIPLGGVDLLDQDLRDEGLRVAGADLSGATVRGPDQGEADLSGLDLSGADLTGADLTGANLTGANLEGVEARGARLAGADLVGARLAGADLEQADLSGAAFAEGDPPGTPCVPRDGEVDLSGASLRGADLSGAQMQGVDASGVDLTQALLDGTRLEAACLEGVGLNLADLRGTILDRATMSGASLINAALRDTMAREVTLTGAFLNGAVLIGADLGCLPDEGEPPLPCEDRFEPNDTLALAADLPPGIHRDLDGCSAEDPDDFFELNLSSGERVTVVSTAPVELLGPGGAPAAFSVEVADDFRSTWVVNASAPRDDTYFLRVRTDGPYTLMWRGQGHPVDTCSDLRSASLIGAQLVGSKLERADLRGANLVGLLATDLDRVPEVQPRECGLPHEVAFGPLSACAQACEGERACVERCFAPAVEACVAACDQDGAFCQRPCGDLLNECAATRTSLAGAHLSAASLSGELDHLDAPLADLGDARVVSATAYRPSFTGAWLRGADLRNADLIQPDLAGADLGQLRGEAARLTGARMQGAQAIDANLREVDLRGADLSRADLTGATLTEADLSDATLTWTRLDGASADRLTARRASGFHTSAVDAQLIGATLEGADLRQANFNGVNLASSSLVGGRLADANLERASFIGADLRGADLSDSNLRGVILLNATVEGASLRRTNLVDAGRLASNNDPNDLAVQGAEVCTAWWDARPTGASTWTGEPLVRDCAGCGDGERDIGESCDDANLQPGDGCSPGCYLEPASCGGSALNANDPLAVEVTFDGWVARGTTGGPIDLSPGDATFGDGDGHGCLTDLQGGATIAWQAPTTASVALTAVGGANLDEPLMVTVGTNCHQRGDWACDLDGDVDLGQVAGGTQLFVTVFTLDGAATPFELRARVVSYPETRTCTTDNRFDGCGDGLRHACEACDDGNSRNGDGCDARCRLEWCGNGRVDTLEACDDGNDANGDGCDATCQAEPDACGNGTLDGGEGCDDGNAVDGDGCTGCQPDGACGDAVVDLNADAAPTEGGWRYEGTTDGQSDNHTLDCNGPGAPDLTMIYRVPERMSLTLSPSHVLEVRTNCGLPDTTLTCHTPTQFGDIELVDLPAGTTLTFIAERGANGPDTPITLNAAIAPHPDGRCGDGVLDDNEGCDDGNDLSGDGCESCVPRTPSCADGRAVRIEDATVVTDGGWSWAATTTVAGPSGSGCATSTADTRHRTARFTVPWPMDMRLDLFGLPGAPIASANLAVGRGACPPGASLAACNDDVSVDAISGSTATLSNLEAGEQVSVTVETHAGSHPFRVEATFIGEPPPSIYAIAGPGESLELSSLFDADALPTWARADESCEASFATAPYDTVTLVNETGQARVLDIAAAWDADGYLYVYPHPFDPDAPGTCLAANDDDTNRFDSRVEGVPIGPGEQLDVVLSAFTGSTELTTWDLTIATQ